MPATLYACPAPGASAIYVRDTFVIRSLASLKCPDWHWLAQGGSESASSVADDDTPRKDPGTAPAVKSTTAAQLRISITRDVRRLPGRPRPARTLLAWTTPGWRSQVEKPQTVLGRIRGATDVGVCSKRR